DYGPFSLADVVVQINKGDIVAGNVIIDKDTGNRVDVHDHPLLGPVVDAARQARDDMRRAHAEVAHQTTQKKRGLVLFGGIGAAMVILTGLAFLVITSFTGKKGGDQVAGIEKVGSAELSVTFSQPKKPERPKAPPGGAVHHASHASGGGNNGDD